MASRNLTEQGWPGRTLVKNDQFEFLAKVCIKFNTLESTNARIHMKGYFNVEDIWTDCKLGRDGKI